MAEPDETIAARSIIITQKDSPLESAIAQLVDRLADPSHHCAKLSHTTVYLEDIFTGTGYEADRVRYDAMIRNLVSAQLAIIDLSAAEQSYYMLGLRQTMSNNPVIALASDNSVPSFANPRFTAAPHPYLDVSDPAWLETADAICKTVNALQRQGWQSDVQAMAAFKVGAQETPFRESKLHAFEFYLPGTDLETQPRPTVRIWRAKVQDATGFDAWVNSENIYMEMARFWDRSVSAQIRKRGAVGQGPLTKRRRKDALGLALAEKMGTRPFVDIGAVYVTPTDPQSLLHARAPTGNGVQYVAHVATTIPDENAGGFKTGGEIGLCMSNVFKALQQTRQQDKATIESVLFPLLGSGDGGAHPALIAHQMVVALHGLLSETDDNTVSALGLEQLKTVGLIAFMPSHLDYLLRELESCGFESKQIGA
ncbi:MAG: hypothetical protein AAFO63_02410 [Pseudomonadota bacterium]